MNYVERDVDIRISFLVCDKANIIIDYLLENECERGQSVNEEPHIIRNIFDTLNFEIQVFEWWNDTDYFCSWERQANKHESYQRMHDDPPDLQIIIDNNWKSNTDNLHMKKVENSSMIVQRWKESSISRHYEIYSSKTVKN